MADFWLFSPGYFEREGGYQNLPDDTGNYNSLGELVGTNMGISAPVYEWFIERPPTEEDMINMMPWEASLIIETQYWDKMKGDQIVSQPLAENIVDYGAHKGTSGATKTLQKLLNRDFGESLSVDGSFGNLTLAAVNAQPPITLYNAFREERIKEYKASGTPFLQGFLNRMNNYFPELPIPDDEKPPPGAKAKNWFLKNWPFILLGIASVIFTIFMYRKSKK